jgi:hypothetical protein
MKLFCPPAASCDSVKATDGFALSRACVTPPASRCHLPLSRENLAVFGQRASHQILHGAPANWVQDGRARPLTRDGERHGKK